MLDIDIADLKRISELIFQKYHYDFRNYAMSSFKRRVLRIMELKKMNVDALLKKLTESPAFINEFLDELTVNVTEMFRDPSFWRIMREEVIPAIMLNHKQFKIWHAGCSSGEEVLSMAIMLKEMGIHHDVTVIATDLDVNILEKAKSATYPVKNMELNEKNYIRFQGTRSFKDYYREDNGQAVFDKELLSNVSFRRHDLVTGDIFNKFDLVLCRNVMIYFGRPLKERVVRLFHESLARGGLLSLGRRESLRFTGHEGQFEPFVPGERMYRKVSL